MKSLLIKTACVIIFMLAMFQSWAGNTTILSAGDNELPWFKESWAWIVGVAILGLLVFGFIKTGEKKPRDR